MATKMEPHEFNGSDYIRIVGFFEAFRLSWDGMGVYKGTSIFLVGQVMKKDPKADLLSKIESQSSSRRSHRRDDTLSSFFQVVNYMLELYADSATISRTYREIIGLEQLLKQSPYRFK